MTYEQFKQRVIEKDEKISSKDIKRFTINYALMVFLSAFAISFTIANILNSLASIILMILSLFLYLFSFSLLVEDHEFFLRCNKIAKFWWLILIFVFVFCFILVTI